MASINAVMQTVKKAGLSLVDFIPKSNKIWIFGAWGGEMYADNPKYLFEYLNREHPGRKYIWITKNPEVLHQVRAKGYKCFLSNSFLGRLFVMLAGVAFESEGNWDISGLLDDKKTKTVQLWHGMGVKALKWDNQGFGENCLRYKSNYLPATSQLYIDVISKLFNAEKTQFKITGYARNDTFVTKPKCTEFEQRMQAYEGCKMLAYLPTHRNFGEEGNKHINPEELRRYR